MNSLKNILKNYWQRPLRKKSIEYKQIFFKKGAFTNTKERKIGKFEEAQSSNSFSIGDNRIATP